MGSSAPLIVSPPVVDSVGVTPTPATVGRDLPDRLRHVILHADTEHGLHLCGVNEAGPKSENH